MTRSDEFMVQLKLLFMGVEGKQLSKHFFNPQKHETSKSKDTEETKKIRKLFQFSHGNKFNFTCGTNVNLPFENISQWQ